MVPVSYSYRNLLVRWKTTLMTAGGFVLVVAALVVMLAFVNGVQTVCVASGEPENVVVLGAGQTDEVLSQLSATTVASLETMPGVARDANRQPLASRELFMLVHHLDEATGGYRFLQVRGVLPVAFRVHSRVAIEEGSLLQPGRGEAIVGRSLARELDLHIGDRVALGRQRWRIVGIFSANGAAFESELWCDLNELASQFRREGRFNTVVLRAATAQEAEALASRLAEERTVSVEAQTEPAYYEKQARQAQVLLTAAWVICSFMGIGAAFGVMNTMFAAVSQRTKEIAVMRILGFKAHEILISFLLEAVLISLIGGGLGAALGYATNGLTQSTALGAREIEFAFRVDAPILAVAAVFSVVMGIVGGILPAMSAMRVRPLEALR